MSMTTLLFVLTVVCWFSKYGFLENSWMYFLFTWLNYILTTVWVVAFCSDLPMQTEAERLSRIASLNAKKQAYKVYKY
jgi:hypothetical protein